MSRTISPHDLAPLIETSAVRVFDVRRPGDLEADSTKISGAQWRDPGEVAAWGRDLPGGAEIVIYCVRGGSVSNAVLDHLLGLGLRARFLEGGFEAWKAAGGPLSGQSP